MVTWVREVARDGVEHNLGAVGELDVRSHGGEGLLLRDPVGTATADTGRDQSSCWVGAVCEDRHRWPESVFVRARRCERRALDHRWAPTGRSIREAVTTTTISLNLRFAAVAYLSFVRPAPSPNCVQRHGVNEKIGSGAPPSRGGIPRNGLGQPSKLAVFIFEGEATLEWPRPLRRGRLRKHTTPWSTPRTRPERVSPVAAPRRQPEVSRWS